MPAGERLVRVTLWISVPFNFAAAWLFASPGVPLAMRLGAPDAAPPMYAALLGFMIALFGAAYAWMALQPAIPRALLAFSAIGKTGVFVIALLLWIAGSSPLTALVAACGDLALAVVWSRWLLRSRVPRAA